VTSQGSDNSTSNVPQGRDSRALLLRAVTFIGGLYFFLYFIAPESLIERSNIKHAHEAISNGFIAVGSMAIGLGIINIITSHGMRTIFLKKGWQYSVALLVGMCVMIGVTIAQWRTTHGLSGEIRKVQVIGDFAARIVEDAKAEPGKHRSYAPRGVLPPLSDRVAALSSYARTTLDAVTQSSLNGITGVEVDSALEQLRSECAQDVTLLRQLLEQVSARSWGSLDAESEAVLTGVAQQAARVGSTYAILKRKESSAWLSSRLYDFLYNGLFNHLGASMFALLGVYIAAAAYRAFRIQSVESALMMTAALVVMLGQISFGKVIYSEMPAIRQWLLEVPNSAAFRAIRLGAGVAGLMLAIRMWLSIESVKRGGKR
jgi:hypothetical protein